MSIICPNLKNKEVKQQFDELVAATSEQAAYHIWSQNEGNAIDRAPNGAPSKLFTDLLEHFNGDRVLAIQAKAKIFSKSFKEWFEGSKVVDENGEPKILYHTVSPSYDASFGIFNTTDEKGNQTMIYFTDGLDMSKSYARNHRLFKTLDNVKKRLSEIPAEIIKRNEYVTSNLNKLTSDETYIKELGYTGFEDQSLLDLIDYYKKSQVDYTESRAKEKTELEAIIENPKSIEYTKLGFLKFKNPLIIDGRGNWWNELSLNPDDDIVEMAKHNNLVNETIEDRIREEAEKKLKGNPSLEVLPYDELLGDDEIEKIRNEVTEEVLKELGDLYKFESTRTIEEYAEI